MVFYYGDEEKVGCGYNRWMERGVSCVKVRCGATVSGADIKFYDCVSININTCHYYRNPLSE